MPASKRLRASDETRGGLPLIAADAATRTGHIIPALSPRIRHRGSECADFRSISTLSVPLSDHASVVATLTPQLNLGKGQKPLCRRA